MMDKYQSAILRVGEAHAAVGELTAQIGAALSSCVLQKDSQSESHLSRAFKETTDSDSPYVPSRPLNIEEVQAELSGNGEDESLACEHCALAHRLIQERKKARIKLGQARAVITRYGNALMKAGEAA